MTKEAYPMALVTQDSLDSYIRSVNSYPMLTPEEERGLAERLHYKGEIDAAKGLILSHLRFVVHVARGYSGYGLPMADLVQEGNIGLMKAVKRFNPEVGVRLVSFAVHWIKAEIHEYVLRKETAQLALARDPRFCGLLGCLAYAILAAERAARSTINVRDVG